MDSQIEEGEILTQKSDKLEGIDSESSLRSLSDTSSDQRVRKTQKDELSSLSYVCPMFNFVGHCNQSTCKKRHFFIQEGLDQLIKDNQPLYDLLKNQGEKLRVPQEQTISGFRTTQNSKHQIIKPKVITNYTPELCEKFKKSLVIKLRNDIDKMEDKLKTINYLKKWVMHNFVDAKDFSELYYSLNNTQRIHFMNFFRVLELQPPQFQ